MTNTKTDFIEKDDNEKIIKQQSILIFNAIRISYTSYESYKLKEIENVSDKPNYTDFDFLEMKKEFLYET